jgi:putative NADPH-quinone reductase
MRNKKIFILLGHPDDESFNRTLADEYERGATDGGHEVRRMNIGDLKFDPVLRHGYRTIQALEPDLQMFQDNVLWCDHFVIFYPTWFSTMPGILKGLFDRAWLPGFAYHFRNSGIGWNRLLKGRSASVFVTSDSLPWELRIIFGDTTNEIHRGILWFAGFSPIRMHTFGHIKLLGLWNRERVKRKTYRFGKKGK